MKIERLKPSTRPNWDAVAAGIPRIKAYCFYCFHRGVETVFETYAGVLIAPPDPDTILTRDQVLPVATCGSAYCERMEGLRQQSVFENLPEIEEARSAFYADHAFYAKNKRHTQSPDLPPPTPAPTETQPTLDWNTDYDD